MALRASADQSQQWAAQLCTICENAIYGKQSQLVSVRPGQQLCCLSEVAVLTPCCMHTQEHETRLLFLRSRLLCVHNGLHAVSIG